jgi:heme exporter protein C
VTQDPTSPSPGDANDAGGRAAPDDGPQHTGSLLTRELGGLALAVLALWALYGLAWSPPDAEMDDLVRVLYVHVPVAILMYAGAFLCSAASGLWLWKRTPGWDALAVAGAELGALFCALTLLTGAIWGRPTWGTFWTWDARLTSTALLQVLLLGYLALRRVEPSAGGGSKRASILGLLLIPNSMIVHYSVDWWRSLHQPATITKLDPTIQGDMLVALMVGLVAGGLVFAWLLVHRFRVAWLEQQVDRFDLDAAVAARRAEGGLPGLPGTTGAPGTPGRPGNPDTPGNPGVQPA